VKPVKFKSFLKNKEQTFGRRFGKITVRHICGGLKKRFRLVDCRRQLFNQIGIVKNIEYDPNRNARIALIYYKGLGLFTYILAPDGLLKGNIIESFKEINVQTEFNIGCSFYLRDIPLGAKINNVEIRPGEGGKFAKSAGTKAIIIRKYKKSCFVGVSLPSKKIFYIKDNSIGTMGIVSNIKHKLADNLKAGTNRNKGIRPSVRGVAMNPVDHPHGGGEGKTSGGRPSVSKWGKLTKGFRTEKNKKKN